MSSAEKSKIRAFRSLYMGGLGRLERGLGLEPLDVIKLISTRCLAFALLAFTLPVTANTIEIDFNSLPSAQSPAGIDWVFQGFGGTVESQIFSVGLNSNNEPTLFQNSIGTSSGQSYALVDTLDPTKKIFTLDVRVAVRNEDFFSNHFGFSFFIVLRGAGLNVAIGETVVQVNEGGVFRNLITAGPVEEPPKVFVLS